MKTTDWFDAENVSPVHIGWYETSLRRGRGYLRLYWAGRFWVRHDGISIRVTAFPWKGDKWRGLARKAK